MLLQRAFVHRHRIVALQRAVPMARCERRMSCTRTAKITERAAWPNSVSATACGLALLASIGLFNGRKTIHAEAKQHESIAKGRQASLTKDDVSLLCLIGYPRSGKSVQASNLERRWGKEGWQTVTVDSLKALHTAIKDRKKEGERLSLIVDGFPRSWEEARSVEKEVCEIFCYAFFHFEQDEWMKRTGGSQEEYRKLERSLKPLREGPRERGNILEIVADWPQDEVWKMVEAKVEQVIELREMGEM